MKQPPLMTSAPHRASDAAPARPPRLPDGADGADGRFAWLAPMAL
ncbi:hypothetical protein [Actinacidiphila sp. ITFR-21]|nr:hypothetical protein [Streptomyces sp. ITFR-21]WNI16170.1 hypothetical protein RLT57_11920 [Streptomyces sp. ITFR-21]